MIKNKGITLIALIITIIVLLILAGITISLVVGDNGILNRSVEAGRKYKIEAVREEIVLAIAEIQTNEIEQNRNLTKETIMKELPKKLEGLKILNDTIIVEYKGYQFKIDDAYNVIQIKPGEPIITSKKNTILFSGSTYISTNVPETELMKNNEFTIALQVKLYAKDAPNFPNLMNLIGNHIGSSQGISLQFATDKKTLQIVPSAVAKIDYTPYFDKWTDIVVTYKDKTLKLYMNDILVSSAQNVIVLPYQNVLIGTGLLSENRACNGMISSVKLWRKELTQEQLNKMDMLEERTATQRESLLLEVILDSIEDINTIGSIVGSNYEFIDRNSENYEFRFNGGSFLNTNINENAFIPNTNSQFTIATRVKINRTAQSNIDFMGILGNHNASQGIALQFYSTTTTLQLVPSGKISIDYTPYYNKWTDIVVTYNNGNTKLYMNGSLIASATGDWITPLSNVEIGCSYASSDRGMAGYMKCVKIWTKEVTQDKISNLSLMETETDTAGLFKEIYLKELAPTNSFGNFVGSNYGLYLTNKE